MTSDPNRPHLKRVLGRRIGAAVLSWPSSISTWSQHRGERRSNVCCDHLALLFFCRRDCGDRTSDRYPAKAACICGEGSVGDFHGFLSGWCYWTNNMLYVPTVMLYFVGVSVFVLGPSHAHSRTINLLRLPRRWHCWITHCPKYCRSWDGKWINNVGAIALSSRPRFLLAWCGDLVALRHDHHGGDFRIPANPRFVLNSFGLICSSGGPRTCLGHGR